MLAGPQGECPETVDRIRALNLRGIHFLKESKRFYPKGDLAAQVIGYVGTDGKGLSGIERKFNDETSGQPGQMMISVDAHKTWFSSVGKESVPGENIILTIDQQIQYIAERELDAAMQQTHAESGTVVVENPHTGEILALANRPTFDPNDSREITSKKLINHAVSDVYEPGSTFKLVTIAAALEEKLTRPDEVVDCQMGSIVFNGMRIRDSKPHGLLSVGDVLAESSDVGAIKIGMRLGNDRFYKYIHEFGFGQRTGIELPHETRGYARRSSIGRRCPSPLSPWDRKSALRRSSWSRWMSTFANDGVWEAPRILANTTAPQSMPPTVEFHPGHERRVISPMTAAEMRQMMRRVVLHGTGRKAVLEGYSSAGKTGTAQKVDPATGAYSHTKYVGSFAGFAPINNPAVTVAVILDSAVGLHQGGQVAAPVFQRITQQVLEYLHVPHDIDLPPNRQVWLAQNKVKDSDLDEISPDHLGSALELADTATADPSPATAVPANAKPAAAQGPIVPAALREREPPTTATAPPADSTPHSQEPPAPTTATSGTVVLDVEQGGIEVPSFIGKSVRGAIEAAQDCGLELNPVGSGIAREQSPAPGTHVTAGSRVVVRFGR